jgi:dTMP kinase
MLNKGKFIVIDGTDGSGKATQTYLLVQKLRDCGYEVEIADFPQYGQKSAGLVEEYLNGKFGSAMEIGPYRASIFYACDRYDASFKIRKWLLEGKIVVSNRYVTANMGHQGGKIEDNNERKKYFDWLYDLEYGIFNIPKPDLNIILHVPAVIAQKLVDNKDAREYLAGAKRDMHEVDLDHLQKAESVYLEIAESFPDFILIECAPHNQILSRENISEMVWREAIKTIDPDYFTRRYYAKPAEFFQVEEKERGRFPDFKSALEKQTPAISETKVEKILKVKKILSTAKMPSRAYEHDAGLDIYSADYYTLMPGERELISTGIQIALPENFVGLIWDKSSVASFGVHALAGVIDSGYRGEIMINLINLGQDIFNIAPGQKVAQLIIQKIENIHIAESEELDATERNFGGFGSSGAF